MRSISERAAFDRVRSRSLWRCIPGGGDGSSHPEKAGKGLLRSLRRQGLYDRQVRPLRGRLAPAVLLAAAGMCAARSRRQSRLPRTGALHPAHIEQRIISRPRDQVGCRICFATSLRCAHSASRSAIRTMAFGHWQARDRQLGLAWLQQLSPGGRARYRVSRERRPNRDFIHDWPHLTQAGLQQLDMLATRRGRSQRSLKTTRRP